MMVSPARRKIEGPAGSLQVEPLTMQVFLLLLDHANEVVTRDAIFAAGWGGAMVGDDSLNRAINRVRRIAAETGPDLFEIETIPRTGYRLIGDFPGFEMNSGSVGDEQPEGISRRTLALAGGAVAISAGAGVWFLKPERATSGTDDRVKRAKQILRFGQATSDVSVAAILKDVVAKDPHNGEALGLLAYALAESAVERNAGSIAEAKVAIDRALAVDPRDPNARMALLFFNTSNFDWVQTEDELLAVLKDDPDNHFALSRLVFLYQGAGLTRRSWDLNERLIALDPVAPMPMMRRGLKSWIYGRTAEADKVLERLIRIWPAHASIWNARFLVLAFTDRANAAQAMLDYTASPPKSVNSVSMVQWGPTFAALKSPTATNRQAAVEANVAAARQSAGQAAYAAMAMSAIRELDAAYAITDGLLFARGDVIPKRPVGGATLLVNDQSWRHTQWLSTPPMFDFRGDSRFKSLCDEMGLTAYWKLRRVKPDYPPTRMP